MKTALLLIDLQNDFLRADGLTPPAGAIVANAARLLCDWRASGRTVIHIWTTVWRDDDRRMPHWRKNETWSCVAGTDGHATPISLTPRDGEMVIHKTFFSGFSTGELESYLRENGIEKVILAGVHTHGCIRSTALAAYEKGFEVEIAADAIGGYDAIHSTISEDYLDGRAGLFLDSDEIESGPIDENIPGIQETFSLARTAFTQWQNVTLAQRQSVLLSLAEKLAQHAEELATILVEDIGKPITLARGEVQRSIDLLLTVCRGATDHFHTSLTTGWRRVPLGVVALISPFNNPLAIPIGKLAPALLHGNVVVWKPAIPGSRIATRTAELLAELIPGALQVVLGGKRAARECMSRADAVTLSGSPEAGRAAQLICARRCLPLQAELGGNNAAIVWHDSDLTPVAAAVADGAFAFAGQRCTANRRVIVDAAIYPEFLEHLKALLPAFAPLNPMEPGSRLGPLISVRSRERLEASLQRAVAAGCDIFSLPKTQPQDSAWMNPVIVCAPDPSLEIVQEESFGPILVVQKAATWEHALDLCNGVRQGLAAACFTSDTGRIDDFLRTVRCGILKLNRSTADADVDLPFGGWKTSGLGPAEHGPANVEFYTRMQAIYR
ncbi:MAG: aldehyde dehydrogenase family protein [Chthoniobacterales bacterium]